jgi:hypothetical protein
LPLIAGYLDRYGVRCDKIRITSRDLDGLRTTWIGMTLGAVENLAALRARSPRIPLRDTAEVAGRRTALGRRCRCRFGPARWNGCNGRSRSAGLRCSLEHEIAHEPGHPA